MPVVHPRTPTVCLVGAPNVGKSSLVRILSSGKPEVQLENIYTISSSFSFIKDIVPQNALILHYDVVFVCLHYADISLHSSRLAQVKEWCQFFAGV